MSGYVVLTVRRAQDRHPERQVYGVFGNKVDAERAGRLIGQRARARLAGEQYLDWAVHKILPGPST